MGRKIILEHTYRIYVNSRCSHYMRDEYNILDSVVIKVYTVCDVLKLC